MQQRKSVFKVVLLCIIFCLAALSWPTLYFHFFPLPEFDQALSVYNGQVPVVLGGRDGFSEGKSYHRRNYILLPNFFRDPKFIRVAQTGDEQPKITETNAAFELCLLFAIVVFSLSSYLRKKRTPE
jgi:hypothetical protein